LIKIDAVRKIIPTSKYVNIPSTRSLEGNPNPPTNAPTMAVITMDISGDFNFQLARAKVATIIIAIIVV
jgi:hypothetical protein